MVVVVINLHVVPRQVTRKFCNINGEMPYIHSCHQDPMLVLLAEEVKAHGEDARTGKFKGPSQFPLGWARGRVGAWVCGRVGVWVRGRVDAWARGWARGRGCGRG